jgi:imidazolonepropionase-like amidohydrolase
MERKSMSENKNRTVVLRPDRVIDGRSAQALENTAVVIEGQSIAAVIDQDNIPGDAEMIELPGMTLMPGMINCHEHPLMYADDYQNAHLQASSAYKALKGLASLQRLLLHGWTGVRVLGDIDVHYANQDIRKVIEEGVFTGPRMTGAGHYISITGGGGDINYVSPEQCLCTDGLIADGADEMLKAVRNEAKFGADWIKLLVTGAFMTVGDDPKNVAFSPDELRTAVEEANRLNLPVAVHAHATEGIKQAVRAGVRSIEHGTYLDDEAIELMLAHGTYLVPTIYIGDYYGKLRNLRAQEKNDEYYDQHRDKFLSMVGKAHAAGVKIAVGLDLGGYNVDPVHFVGEFAVLVEAGLTPMEAIQAGTRIAAELLLWDKLGTIEEGQLADVIAVPGNPLDDITALENVGFVMIDGNVVKRPGSEARLAGILGSPSSI